MARWVRWRGVLLLALGLVMRAGHATAASDALPGQRWFSWRNGDFHYHFTTAGRPFVAALAPLAPRAFRALVEFTGNTPATPIHVVIVPDNDITNGLTTPLTRNTIRLYPMPPRQHSSLAEYDDFLTLLFTHELLHVFHLDHVELPMSLLRYVLGRNTIQYAGTGSIVFPVGLGFPQALVPDTLLEGYAVYAESRLAGRGRGNTAGSLTLLRNMARDDDLPRLGGAVGLRRHYPGGASPYLFGGQFHAHAAKAGSDWQAIYELNARGLFPWLWWIPFKVETGEFPSAAWNTWRRDEARAAAAFTAARSPTIAGQPIGAAAYDMRALRLGPDGVLRVSLSDGQSHDAVAHVDAHGRLRRDFDRDGGEGIAFAADGSVWLDSYGYVSDTAIVSDLFAVPPGGGRTRQLTHGARLFEPDIFEHLVVAVRRDGARFCLDVASLTHIGQGNARATTCAPDFMAVRNPRWSPEGRRVAFVADTQDAGSDLFVWDVARARVERQPGAASDEAYPQWSASGDAIYAVRTWDGVPELHRLDLASRTWRQLTRSIRGVWQYAYDETAQTLWFAAPGESGWQLYRAALDPAAGRPEGQAPPRGDPRLRRPQPLGLAPPQPIAAPLHPYRAWRTLAPMGWTPLLSVRNAGRDAYGGAAFGRDVLWEWTIGLQGVVDDAGNPDVAFDLSRDAGPWIYALALDVAPAHYAPNGRDPLDGRLDLRATRVRRHANAAGSATLALGVEDRLRGDLEARAEPSVALRWDSRRRYRYGLVPGDGIATTVRAAFDAPVEGGPLPDGRIEGSVASGGFILGRVQWQAQADAASHARRDGPWRYRLLGPSSVASAARSRVARGAPAGEVAFVDRFVLWDTELIFPVFPQAGAGAVPLFLDAVSLRPFVAGAHWQQRGATDAAIFAGGELALDMAVLWTGSLPLRIGWRQRIYGEPRGERDWYVGVSLPFAAGSAGGVTALAVQARHHSDEFGP